MDIFKTHGVDPAKVTRIEVRPTRRPDHDELVLRGRKIEDIVGWELWVTEDIPAPQLMYVVWDTSGTSRMILANMRNYIIKRVMDAKKKMKLE